MRHISLFSTALIAALLALPVGLPLYAAEPIAIGIAEVDYVDTSGEVKDQQDAHAERAKRFAEALRKDLEASGRYRIVTLDCGKEPCSVENQIPEDLIGAAKKAGARLLVYGGVHKLSTLVQNMKAQAVDLDADRKVFEQLITFRGDDDESWDRAERFLVRELLEQPLVK
jgi:hypothetical protein